MSTDVHVRRQDRRKTHRRYKVGCGMLLTQQRPNLQA
eukprot:CAMPEP_0204108826 /NCGR_PEP_ID=MMETSP0361-20130328/936_1 /ASSEMBLY_ACC=CAM_ASM_000343 /TAXON_ID=268821 /ORGANISM="Scrippsiella Hangoei, Strain SHTV-5" /LENGTH=36 /DNA_ID= /DNA_START= /DNA_END= /DNA_ORIENTATION=